jgi:ADP-heptose:LPS heptosyltransferase
LPLIETLHHWRPELQQSVLIEAPYAPVFLDHPAIAEVLVLRDRKTPGHESWTRFRAFIELRKHHYPAVLNLHGGSTSMLLTAASGARLRIGQESHRGSWLYSDRIPSSYSIWQRQPLHTVEHQLSIIRWLGIPIPSTPAILHVSAEARTRVHRRLAEAGISKYFLIQPTATLWTKQWKAINFAQLGDSLSANHSIPVIYTAAPHEAAVLREIHRDARRSHTYWSDLPLGELFALIEGCRLFIGCDSGPTHAAAALKKPVVVVWGSSNFKAWHPWGTDFEAVRSELPCIPCNGYACREFGEPRCILEIPVSRAIEACAKVLARSTGVSPAQWE